MLWLFILLAFLLGSIPFGLLLGKVKGIDARRRDGVYVYAKYNDT